MPAWVRWTRDGIGSLACLGHGALRIVSYIEERMNNKEIADRLRRAADELEGDETCIRKYERGAYQLLTSERAIDCTVYTKAGCIKIEYQENLNKNIKGTS